jgi:thioredoxin type arsenate reductase
VGRSIRVLFLCTGNSARSLIAEALLRQIGGAAFEPDSAGVEPKGVNPRTLRALEDAGVDAAGLRSESVADYATQSFDYVITLCDDAAERCPVFPGGVRRLHWSLPDPAAMTGTDAQRQAAFARTIDALRRRITEFAIESRPPRAEEN